MPNSDSAPPMNCAPGPNLVRLEPHGFAIDAGRADEERIDLPRAAGWRAARPEHCRRDGAAIDVRDVALSRVDEIRRERERVVDVSLQLQHEVVAIVLRNDVCRCGEVTEAVRGGVGHTRAVIPIREDQTRARLTGCRTDARRTAVEVREIAAAFRDVIRGRVRALAARKVAARRVVVREHRRAELAAEARDEACALRVVAVAERGLQVAFEPVVLASRDEVDTPATASEPYTADAPSGRISTRSMASGAIALGSASVWLMPESGRR